MRTAFLERFINLTASVVSIVASVKWEPLRAFWDSLDPWGVALLAALAVLGFMGLQEAFYLILGRRTTQIETAEVIDLRNVSYRSRNADIEFERTQQGTYRLTKTVKRGKGPTVSWYPDRLYIIESDS